MGDGDCNGALTNSNLTTDLYQSVVLVWSISFLPAFPMRAVLCFVNGTTAREQVIWTIPLF